MTKNEYPEVESSDVIVRGLRGEAALALFLSELEQEFMTHAGVQFDGLSLRRSGTGWLMVVRATRKGKGLVAFVGGGTLLKTYRDLYWQLYKGLLTWRLDRYR